MKAWAGWVTLGARGFGEGGCIGAAEAGDVEAGEEVTTTYGKAANLIGEAGGS